MGKRKERKESRSIDAVSSEKRLPDPGQREREREKERERERETVSLSLRERRHVIYNKTHYN